jgi:amino acid adenylation domain-containing protein
LTRMPYAERQAEAQRLADEDARLGFDLSQGPLLRTKLLKLDEEEHVMLFTMHHIITDGWSMEILIREAAILYAACSAGQTSPLPELPVQYADFAHWQRAWLQGEVLEAELAYWKKQLAAAPATLDLPTDHPRPLVQSYRGASQSLALSADLTASLKELGRREGVTQFMILLAAFQTLLHRYSGQSHISTGSPIANRNRGETESLIGFFVNTLVMCTDLSGDPPFRTLLKRVREVALGAYAHQDLPFEKLVEELQPQRNLSVTPLFQVMFNLVRFTDDEAGEIELPGLVVETVPSSESGSKFDLTMYAQEYRDRMHLNLVYNADLFEPETITRMFGHFETLLNSIVSAPEKPLSALALLNEDQRRQLLGSRNRIAPVRTFSEFPRAEIDQALGERFRRQVLRAPAQIAVKTKRHCWTYEQLNHRAEAVASALLKTCGDGEEQVALLFPHDAPMIAAMLGSLAAGKAYVPLDAAFPVDRLCFMLDDAQARVLLTDSTHLELAHGLANGQLSVINLDDLELTGTPAQLPAVDPQRRAYLLYTSGSTGQPKAVVQNHRNVLHHIRSYTNSLHLDASDKLTLLPAYGFDASVMDIFGALLNGATLCPFDIKTEGLDALSAWLDDEEITIYHSTPTVFRHLGTTMAGHDLSAVRVVVLGGEAASKRDVEIFKTHFSAHSLFVNGMGPTESTLALQYFMDHETEIQRESIPVGYAVEDTEVRLVNEAGRDVEIYGVGEIEIHSDHVALGYWRQPELTAVAFGEDEQGRRKYRTGDLGRRLPDGAIEYLGRKDLQVKIRGHRVEIAEVERALTEHEDVREAVVMARADEDGGEKRLVAYVVCHEDRSVTSSELRRSLETLLPGHMIPSAFMLLGELPLLMNGKIDRHALPAPDNVRPELDAEYVTPHTEIERAIADIWQSVLKVEKVGLYDNFFDLGGHSLLVVQVHSRLREVFKRGLSLIEMFNYPTVGSLARHLSQKQTEQPTLQRSFSRAENRRELLKRRQSNG